MRQKADCGRPRAVFGRRCYIIMCVRLMLLACARWHAHTPTAKPRTRRGASDPFRFRSFSRSCVVRRIGSLCVPAKSAPRVWPQQCESVVSSFFAYLAKKHSNTTQHHRLVVDKVRHVTCATRFLRPQRSRVKRRSRSAGSAALRSNLIIVIKSDYQCLMKCVNCVRSPP